MQESLKPNLEWVTNILAKLQSWASTHVFSLDGAIQLAAIGLAVVLSALISRQISQWCKSALKKLSKRGFLKLHLTYREIFFLMSLVMLLWGAYTVLGFAQQPKALVFTVSSLASAWAIIRLTASTMNNPFWSRTVAIILWCMAALNILGYLESFIVAMDNAAVTIGEFRLSFLLVFKGLLAFAVLLWLIRMVSGTLKRVFAKADITPSQRVLFYKLSNITLYAIGALVGLHIVGLDLTTLAVFSGALGFGIGFGLQKVFSNLISGIILLLDKSVKPGDVVAIGDTYGWVNSLGARCVSVLTRDGKEHLIPNENLITQEVENWSYSDQKVRVHIEVGVSYSSDIDLVRELLLKAVKDHPRVLDDPQPVCLITGFGDSSIDHNLRVWISDPQEGVSNIKSAIYYKIWQLFRYCRQIILTITANILFARQRGMKLSF